MKAYTRLFFRQRLELMREMYQNGAEMSPGSPDVNLEHANGSDPFYDRLYLMCIPRK